MSRPWVIACLILTYLLVMTIWAYLWFWLGRRHRTRNPGDRWHQGYDTGHRVGWYAAGDQLWDDSQKLRDHYHAGTLTVNVGPDYISGFEDASERINTYWDNIDEGGSSAPHPVEGHQADPQLTLELDPARLRPWIRPGS